MLRRAPAFVGEVVRLSPGRPAWMLGVRTAIATMLPLLLTPWLGAEAASWASTGGFTVALADKGGSYRSRALTMGAVTIGAAVAVAVGSKASGHTVAAVLVMLGWASLCGFSGAAGPLMAAAGGTAAVVFAESLSSDPAGWLLTGQRALAMLGSGLWAMMLSLLFWPIRVYRPARYAVADCFRRLAAQAEALAPAGHGGVRDALEQARQVLADTRRGRLGESGRGTRLLVLLQVADLMFATITSLEEVVDAALVGGAPAGVCAEIERGLGRLVEALRDIAARIETERKLLPAPPVEWGGAALLASLEAARPSAGQPWVGHVEQAAQLMARLGEDVRVAFETAATLYDDSRPRDLRPSPVEAGDYRPLWERVRLELRWDSPLLRHALRVGVVAALAVVVTRALGLANGYYVTLTVIILLTPYTPATFTKTMQRVGGTVLGGIAAALFVRVVHTPAALMLAATVLAGVSAAVLQLNYALFAFFLTPTFVLLTEAWTPDPNEVKSRLVNTVLGGVLALAGARLLWPHRERKRFPDEMANAVHALREHFDEMLRPGEADPVALRASRRRFGLASNQADASFQRLLAESRRGREALEPYMTLMLFARRFAAMIGAAAAARTPADAAETEALDELVRRVDLVLDQLEAAVRGRRLPPPLPALDTLAAQVGRPVLAARCGRLVLQLTVLHHAVARCGRVSLTRS